MSTASTPLPTANLLITISPKAVAALAYRICISSRESSKKSGTGKMQEITAPISGMKEMKNVITPIRGVTVQ
jgi:hypothetical protein